jgi:hypothetical protein
MITEAVLWRVLPTIHWQYPTCMAAE